MSRRENAKPRNRSRKARTPPDETFAAGPVRGARFGRFTVTESNWAPGQFQEFRSSLPTLRANAEASLVQRISETTALVRKFDPFEILARLFVKNSFVDPTTYTESSSTAKEYEAEYVYSLFASLPLPDLAFNEPNDEAFAQLENLIDGIYSNARELILLEPTTSSNLGLEEFRAQMLLRHLMMRGDSYPQHHADLVRAIGAPHDRYLHQRYGFTSEELVTTFDAIEDQVQTRLRAFGEFFVQAREAHQAAIAKLTENDISSPDQRSSEEWARMLASLVPDDTRRELGEKQKAIHRTGRELLAIDATDARVSTQVLDACACAPGDNAAFLAGRFAGYPTAETMIWTRPIIRLDGAAYCPSPVVLFRSSLEVLEGLLLRDPAYTQAYQDARGKSLERLAVQYLQELLPGASLGVGLFYPTADGKRAETDAVLVLVSSPVSVRGDLTN